MSARATLLFALLMALNFVLQGAVFASGVSCAHASSASQAALDVSPDADPHAHHRGPGTEQTTHTESVATASAPLAGLCDCGCTCASTCLTPCASALMAMLPAALTEWAESRLHPAGEPTDVISPPSTIPLRPPIFV
jgi:hypothetical protein